SVSSWGDRRRPVVRWTLRIVQTLVLIGLIVAAVLPLVWLAKASVSTTTELVTDPLTLIPSVFDWSNYAAVWN
ncbi:hypothetical protein ACPXAP_25990, partial [Escherichia coli]